MLGFFRKYQMIFFPFIAGLLVCSFAFFGPSNPFLEKEIVHKDFSIGNAVDGSEISYLEMKRLASLLSEESGEEGVIRKDFLKTGIAKSLFTAYLPLVQKEWEVKLSKMKQFCSYVHPQLSFVSANAMWQRFCPTIPRELESLKTAESLEEGFETLTRLYLLEKEFPPTLLRQVLLYQLQSAKASDPELLRRDLALFGYHRLEDWFGRDFLELTAQFIANGAAVAKKKGYVVSQTDIEKDLAQRFPSQIPNQEILSAWKHVLLFKRYVDDVKNSIFLDSLPHRQFEEMSSQMAKIDLYELPAELRLKSFEDFIAFETYLHFTSGKREHLLALPSVLRSAQEVKQDAPELVFFPYRLKVAILDKKQLSRTIPLKKVWQWQLEKENANRLCTHFSWASSADLGVQLEALSFAKRVEVDEWSRSEMVRSNLDWLEEEMDKVPSEYKSVSLFPHRGKAEGLVISEIAVFYELLDSVVALEEHSSLKYFEGDDLIYRIDAVEKIEDGSLLSFGQALKSGALEDLVDRYLESKYNELRKERPFQFQNESGEWKSFLSVREEIARIVFRPVLEAIERESPEKKAGDGSFYATHRFWFAMRSHLLALQNGELPQNSIWEITAQERTIQRTVTQDWMMQEPFDLTEGQWSPIRVSPNGEIVFFFLHERFSQSSQILDRMLQTQQTLAEEAQLYLATGLIEVTLKKKSITLPICKEEKDG